MTQSCEPPNIWVLKSGRAGENTQLLALADALGWDYQVKQMKYRSGIPYFLLKSSLRGIYTAQSGITEPWPDLIISAGAKNEPVCRWIRDNADKKVCLIHIGRPWANLKQFDLIVTTPQYRLPQRHNVHINTVPMHYQTNSDIINQAVQHWAPRLDHLPKPYTALMVGGHSGPYSFDKRAAQRLVNHVTRIQSLYSGSLLVSTSARTPGHIADYLEVHLPSPSYFYRWGSSQENPYYAFLTLTESIIVTGDSISMLSEACATLKPVYIFDLGEGPVSMRANKPFDIECLKYFYNEAMDNFELDHLRNIIYRLAMWKGPKRLTRDLRLVHQTLIAQQRAVWLGEQFPTQLQQQPFDDVQRTVNRIKRLMNDKALTTSVSESHDSLLAPVLTGSD